MGHDGRPGQAGRQLHSLAVMLSTLAHDFCVSAPASRPSPIERGGRQIVYARDWKMFSCREMPMSQDVGTISRHAAELLAVEPFQAQPAMQLHHWSSKRMLPAGRKPRSRAAARSAGQCRRRRFAQEAAAGRKDGEGDITR